MSEGGEIRPGMAVYGSEGQLIGTVEELRGGGFRVNGWQVLLPAVALVEEDRVYLRDPGTRLRVRSTVREGD